VKARGSVGNEFRELVRKLEKLDRAPQREARRRQKADAKADAKRHREPPPPPVRPTDH